MYKPESFHILNSPKCIHCIKLFSVYFEIVVVGKLWVSEILACLADVFLCTGCDRVGAS